MRERNRRAREYSRRCWERRWNRRLWILNILLGLAIAGILLWALTLPEAQEPEDAPLPLPAVVQAAVLSAAKPPENLLVCDITGYCACCTPYADINRNEAGQVLTALEAALRTSRAYLYGDEDKADIPKRTAETERIAALIPHGRRNAISRAKLAAAMQTSDRMMRKAVSEAKRQGVMICNDGEGYYQTEELGDLYRQYKRDTARAMSILKARKPMRDVLKAAGRPV